MNELRNKYSEKVKSFIYLTPVDASIPKKCNKDTLIVFGSRDRLLNEENINLIKKHSDVDILM